MRGAQRVPYRRSHPHRIRRRRARRPGRVLSHLPRGARIDARSAGPRAGLRPNLDGMRRLRGFSRRLAGLPRHGGRARETRYPLPARHRLQRRRRSLRQDGRAAEHRLRLDRHGAAGRQLQTRPRALRGDGHALRDSGGSHPAHRAEPLPRYRTRLRPRLRHGPRRPAQPRGRHGARPLQRPPDRTPRFPTWPPWRRSWGWTDERGGQATRGSPGSRRPPTPPAAATTPARPTTAPASPTATTASTPSAPAASTAAGTASTTRPVSRERTSPPATCP